MRWSHTAHPCRPELPRSLSHQSLGELLPGGPRGALHRTRRRVRGFDIRFAYSAWRYFLQWTIEVLGRPLFQKLLLGFMDHPAEAEQVFRDVHGEDLSIAVVQFDGTVRAGGWTPTGVER